MIEPPWKAFPRIPWGSVGWRMGFGEEHWNKWCKWFSSLPDENQINYQAEWPEPEDWNGFYLCIKTGEPPPWFVERQKKIAAAAFPPAPDENEIRDPLRASWMLQTYLKRPKVSVRVQEYSCSDEVFRDPEGNAWCLKVPRDGGAAYVYRYEGKLIGENNLEVKRPIP